MDKECNICHKTYDISLFPFFIRKTGSIYILNQCISCHKKYKKNYYIINSNKYSENNKKNYIKNKIKLDKYGKEYRSSNKEKNNLYQKEYREKNKEKLNTYKANYIKNRLNNDPLFKIRRNVSRLVSSYLKRYGFRKNKSSILDHIGYTIDDLKKHLEKQFEPWMSWNNWGVYDKNSWIKDDPSTWTWQIDHIIPQTMLPYEAVTDDNFKKCWKLENLRPISAKVNLVKSNKITENY